MSGEEFFDLLVRRMFSIDISNEGHIKATRPKENGAVETIEGFLREDGNIEWQDTDLMKDIIWRAKIAELKGIAHNRRFPPDEERIRLS